MNYNDYTLIQSLSQLALQPKTEFKFTDFLSNQPINDVFYLVAITQVHYIKEAMCHMMEYSHEKLLGVILKDQKIAYLCWKFPLPT
ncbi:MAG: hypothetical protein KME59_27140 [Trichormus sp. ATA11-4-KO1]|jgi:hypothetical protein|nr:hypothetical protein [Trichormus sp. ATA11-4-KO1]